MTTLGVLHPGSMGAAVAAQAQRAGADVLWCPTGRREATCNRAERYGLSPVGDLHEMAERSDIIMSLCPPAAAVEVARTIADTGYDKIYVDANAIAPTTMQRICTILRPGGTAIVDAAVVGSPPSEKKTPHLYLSGPESAVGQVVELFQGTAVRTRTLPGEVGQASALKLSYSAFQKSSRILAAVSYALANDHGVAAELLDIAGTRGGSYLSEPQYFPKTASRSWRWGPEMREVAMALEEAGLPSELADAAASTMGRWDDMRDSTPDLSQALRALHTPPTDKDP